jgi:hypothetical protein
MGTGRVVTSPDGDRWRVRRRWLDRGLPKLGKGFRRGRKELGDSGFLDGTLAFEGLMGTAIGLVAIGLAAAVAVVVLPLLGIALELALVVLLLASGLFGRVFLRRPWTVEAIDLDDGERSVAFAIKGYREAGRAAQELAAVISASGPPAQLPAGERAVLPRPTFQPGAQSSSTSRCLTRTITSSRAARSRRMRSATVTERWRPPVQPTAIVKWLLPSVT